MGKKSFYALCRYLDGNDAMKIGYLKKEGFDVPNDFGFDLAVYKTIDNPLPGGSREASTWHVVDTRSGLSIAMGDTRKKAVEAAMKRLESLDMKTYASKLLEVQKAYGECPGHRISYL